MKSFNILNATSIVLLGILILSLTICPNSAEASKCRPSGRVKAKSPQPPECNTAEDGDGGDSGLCCIEGKTYKLYNCSPPVTKHTKAHMTLTSFETGSDAPSACDGKYHSDHEFIVALSTGWYHRGSRCLKNVTIRAKGRKVAAVVVGECDSTAGCDADHDYQPPCGNNIVDASMAVWKALGLRREDWGWLDVTWSDA